MTALAAHVRPCAMHCKHQQPCYSQQLGRLLRHDAQRSDSHLFLKVLLVERFCHAMGGGHVGGSNEASTCQHLLGRERSSGCSGPGGCCCHCSAVDGVHRGTEEVAVLGSRSAHRAGGSNRRCSACTGETIRRSYGVEPTEPRTSWTCNGVGACCGYRPVQVICNDAAGGCTMPST